MERPLFNDDASLKDEALKLSKREAKVVEDKNGKHILMGTDLAFEDYLWNAMRDTLIGTCERLGLKIDEEADWLTDASSELRDKALEEIAHGEDVDLVLGSDEY